ncbi:MAG: hypothetical protein Q8P50_04665 [Bacillota bacterium]|nr:hypothetical protein [Bacillota bacterium]
MSMNESRPRGRKPISPDWVEWIRSVAVTQPQLGSKALATAAVGRAEKEGRNDPPSERTIRKYMREIREASDDVQREYRFIYWPETFERGDLPWEAAEHVFELLRSAILPVMDQPVLVEAFRPELREARWFWRVTQTAPAMSFEDRRSVALFLLQDEVFGSHKNHETKRTMERHVLKGQFLMRAAVPAEDLPSEVSSFVHDIAEVFLAERLLRGQRLLGRHPEGTPEEDCPDGR